MNKTIVGDIGFLSGMISVLVIAIPFLGLHEFLGAFRNAILALILGSVGITLSFIQSKKYTDEVSKAGLVVNPVGILLGIISLVFL